LSKDELEAAEAAKNRQEHRALGEWLMDKGIGAGADFTEGMKSKAINMFRPFVKDFGISPVVVLQALKQNPQLAAEAHRTFRDAFITMTFWARNSIRQDELEAAKEAATPGVAPTVKPAESPKQEEAKAVPKAEIPTLSAEELKAAREKYEQETGRPYNAPPAPAPAPKTEQHIKTTKEVAEALGKKPRRPKEKEKPAVPPGATEPAPITVRNPADDLNLAVSAAQRTEREITRLGRVRNLSKLAMDLDWPTKKDLKDEHYNWGLFRDSEDFTKAQDDVYDLMNRETFDEEKEYAPDQMMLEQYKDIQEKDEQPTIDEEILDLEMKLSRLQRQIKLLEMSGGNEEELEKLHEEARQTSNLIEHLDENVRM
jgi:hypothetical protein